MERPIAWLMTVVAAAGMTAYADGLERPRAQIAAVSAPADKIKAPTPGESGPQEIPETAS